MQHDLEARVAIGVVDAAEVDEHVERASAGRRGGSAQTSFQLLGLDDGGVVAELRVGLEDRVAELLP